MIFWNTQVGRVYPQSSGISHFIARIFKNVQVVGVGTPQEIFAGNFAIPSSSAIVFSVTEAIPFEIADPVI